MIQKEFYNKYNALKEDTKFSSFHDTKNPLYLELLGMGKNIIPLLLNNIWDSWWSIITLHELTKGACNIAEEDYGRFDLISTAWYRWGVFEGYVQKEVYSD